MEHLCHYFPTTKKTKNKTKKLVTAILGATPNKVQPEVIFNNHLDIRSSSNLPFQKTPLLCKCVDLIPEILKNISVYEFILKFLSLKKKNPPRVIEQQWRT